MLDFLYEWILNLSYYMVLMTAIMQVLPSKAYKKYLQFYIGLVIILVVCNPLLKMMGMTEKITSSYYNNTYRMELEDLQERTKYLKEVKLNEYINQEDRLEENQ